MTEVQDREAEVKLSSDTAPVTKPLLPPAQPKKPSKPKATVPDNSVAAPKPRKPKGERKAFYRVFTGAPGGPIDCVCVEQTKGRALRAIEALHRIRGYTGSELWAERCYRV